MDNAEKITNYETLKHIENVKKCLDIIIVELLKRGEEHDKSKLDSPELELFTKVTHQLNGCSYNSDEYKQFLKELKPALDHHYSRNKHHPEHFKNGIDDMDIIDLIEMLADWKSSTLRHQDGNLRKSIEINRERFQMSQQLINILENSIGLFDDIK